jgi:hypothetical protein
MDFLGQIRQIEMEAVRHRGVSQIVIDLIEDIDINLDDKDGTEPVSRDEVGSFCYKIIILLDVFNPNKEYDISVLKRLYDILAKWRADIEFVNRTLGMPLHLG